MKKKLFWDNYVKCLVFLKHPLIIYFTFLKILKFLQLVFIFFLFRFSFLSKEERTKKCELHKISKEKMTGRVDIHIWKKWEKKFNKRSGKTSFLVNFSENAQNFFGCCDFYFIAIFSNLRQSILTLPVILSFLKFF